MSDEHRGKIRNSNILNALIEHTLGERDMSSTQVTAGLGLLKKVMPDLSAIEMDANVAMSHEDALYQLDDEPETDKQADPEPDGTEPTGT